MTLDLVDLVAFIALFFPFPCSYIQLRHEKAENHLYIKYGLAAKKGSILSPAHSGPRYRY